MMPYFPKTATAVDVIIVVAGAGGELFSPEPPLARTLLRASCLFSEREEEEYDAAAAETVSSLSALRDLAKSFFSFPLRFLL